MKKIIFANIPMYQSAKSFNYGSEKNKNVSKDFEVSYVINALMPSEITDGDEVKVVSLILDASTDLAQKNNEEFQKEFQMVTAGKNITVEYVTVKVPFSESTKDQETFLKNAIGTLEDKADVYYDMTFGAKSVPIIMFTVLNFAEKFFDCDIKNIAYSKGEFKNGEIVKAEYCDMASLYYLNQITNNMTCENSEEAKQMLDVLLNF